MLDLSNQSSDTFVGRLVAAGGDDPLRQQLRLSYLLSGADFRPAGMPDSSILLIRKLRDPSPELLSVGARSGAVPQEWQRGVRDSVGEFMRLAARPAAGEFANCENAVLFMDRAELLACLARDWCDYRIVERWWWRTLLRADSSFLTTWIRNPEYVPAAMAQLARSHTVSRFAAAVSEQEARTLTQRLIEAFALDALTQLFADLESDNRAPQDRERSVRKQFRKSAQLEPRSSQVRAPWHEVITERAALSLPPAQQLFVGLALMIYQSPSLVRTRRFALDVAQWQRQEFETELEVTRPGNFEIELPSLAEAHLRRRDSREVRLSATKKIKPESFRETSLPEADGIKPHETGSDLFEPATADERDFRESPERRFAGLEHFEAGVDQPVRTPTANSPNEVDHKCPPETPRPVALVEPETNEDQIEEGVVRHAEIDAEATDSLIVSEDRIESINSPSLDQEMFAGLEIETSLGGFFYLVNLALYLNLYADFTRPADAGIELNIWDFVTLVGSELMHDAAVDDPIFSLLATLAGRDQTAPPGEYFGPSDAWRLPIDWLALWEAKEVWGWSVIDDRLRVRHPNGFVVLDLPIDGSDVAQQLHEEIEPYQDFILKLERTHLEDEVLNAGLGTLSPTQLWLSRLMPYVRARLRAALGASEDPGSIVCRQNALVRANETHVDVFFNLSEHPIELRLAGLDRDPGWVPAAGRFIRFHYN